MDNADRLDCEWGTPCEDDADRGADRDLFGAVIQAGVASARQVIGRSSA